MNKFKEVTVFIYNDKDYMYNVGLDLGLTGEALHLFKYALSETKFKLKVDMETGIAEILGVNNFNI